MFEVENVKVKLKKDFDMKDLQVTRKILGIEIWTHDLIRHNVSRETYIRKILDKLSDEQSSKVVEEYNYINVISYANIVGYMMYVMFCTCVDIAYVVSAFSRFMSNLGRAHWQSFKWILRYLKGSWKNFSLWWS